ncbi:hypothetical protein D3C81_1528660 [compost metagenome]
MEQSGCPAVLLAVGGDGGAAHDFNPFDSGRNILRFYPVRKSEPRLPTLPGNERIRQAGNPVLCAGAYVNVATGLLDCAEANIPLARTGGG